jgi:AcrR family transcriptional regulator
LSQAAVRLLAARGYEETTAAEIAAAAKVTERTFFMHFATKADAVIHLEPARTDDLAELIVAQPAGEDDLVALENALVAWQHQHGRLDENHRDSALVHAAAAKSTTLRGRQLDGNHELARVAANALAVRHRQLRPTLLMRVTAEAVLRIFHLIVSDWGGGGLRTVKESPPGDPAAPSWSCAPERRRT